MGILAAAAAIALLYFGRVFFITVIIAAMIAFLLDPLVVFFMKLRMPRGLASFVVCSIALVVLYLAGLGLYLQSQQIASDLPAYGARINEMVDSVATRMENVENGIYRSLVPRRFQPQQADAAPNRTARTYRPRQKEKGRAAVAAAASGGSGSTHPAGAHAAVLLRLQLSGGLLRRLC